MSDSYIIEVSSQAAGIVVRDASGYRFFAASQPFYRLDGRLFRHVVDAQRAAVQLANDELNAASGIWPGSSNLGVDSVREGATFGEHHKGAAMAGLSHRQTEILNIARA